MTELNRPDRDLDQANPVEPGAPNPASYSKGDVLHPEWGERPLWFGYIGVGIAIAAMLLGIALMVVAGGYAWRWMAE